jgi:hypothetical protein
MHLELAQGGRVSGDGSGGHCCENPLAWRPGSREPWCDATLKSGTFH